MSGVHLRASGDVAVLTLERGATHPLDLALLRDLAAALDAVAESREARALVLTGSGGRFFSIGFDIPGLFDLDRAGFGAFLETFDQLCLQLYALAKPTVAALSGHAIAGGCILALCCDRRILREGRTLMGLNEVKLGLPVPFPAYCIARDLVGGRAARVVMEGGEFHGPEALLHLGLVDDIAPESEVMARALDLAGGLGASPGRAFALIKRDRVGPVVEAIRRDLAAREADFLDAWFSDPARERIREAMDKFRDR